MIAGNEARRIRRALDSVSGWTSEVVVLLNEDVNDGTDQVAESCGAKVFRESWKGYIAQKNSAAQKAAQEWILGLDADETVSPQLRAEIRQLFAEPEKLNHFAAYSFPRCTFYCGRWIRHGDWYPDRQIRLWQRGAAKWGGVDPHAKLQVNGPIGNLRSDLLHYSMESFDHQVRKMLRYADDFARHCRAHGRRASIFDLLTRPPWRFFRGFVLKLGFLDGWPGYAVARMVAFETFLRYAKAREAQMLPPP
jgi:glycosyltransferase involved in cell wall biosynthesis